MDQRYDVLIEQSIVSHADLEEAAGVKQDYLVKNSVKEINVDEFVEEGETALVREKGLEIYLHPMGIMIGIDNCEVLIAVLFTAEVY